jgi:hypothetical protein
VRAPKLSKREGNLSADRGGLQTCVLLVVI